MTKKIIDGLEKYKKFVKNNKKVIDLVATFGCHKEKCGPTSVCDGWKCLSAKIKGCINDN